MEYHWIYRVERQALHYLCKSLYIESSGSKSSKDIIDIILSKYILHNISGYNNISFKVFVSEDNVIIFELNNNGKYSLQDFITPTLTISNYDKVSYLDNIIFIKKKNEVFIVSDYIEKIES